MKLDKMDYNKIDNIQIDGIDLFDAPDFTDAYISKADYNGVEMNNEELNEINNDRDFVYSQVLKHLY